MVDEVVRARPDPVPAPVQVVVYAQSVERLAHFYASVLDLAPVAREDGFAVLQGQGFELSVVAMPAEVAASPAPAATPPPREDTPIKVSFLVPSVDGVRAAVEQAGGTLKPASAGWSWHGQWHLDGVDAEGNVFQLRQRRA